MILIDLDTKKVIRHFHGHKGPLTDASFSPNARWLITSSMDCTIRTWDILSSHLIDVFQVSFYDAIERVIILIKYTLFIHKYILKLCNTFRFQMHVYLYISLLPENFLPQPTCVIWEYICGQIVQFILMYL